MIPSGPFVLANGVTGYYNDPTFAQPQAAAVQIQNASGFFLTVQIGGANYILQPFCASTVPTNNSYQLVVTPNQPQGNFGVLLSLAWLQPNEMPPMADGPLTQGSTQSFGFLSVNYELTTINVLVAVLPSPPAGYVYSLFSLLTTPLGGAGWAVNLCDFDVNTIYAGPITTTPYALNSLIANGRAGTVSSYSSTSNLPVICQLRYDLFPAPIS